MLKLLSNTRSSFSRLTSLLPHPPHLHRFHSAPFQLWLLPAVLTFDKAGRSCRGWQAPGVFGGPNSRCCLSLNGSGSPQDPTRMQLGGAAPAALPFWTGGRGKGRASPGRPLPYNRLALLQTSLLRFNNRAQLPVSSFHNIRKAVYFFPS